MVLSPTFFTVLGKKGWPQAFKLKHDNQGHQSTEQNKQMTKILIVAPSWVGDAVMAEPLYRRLHERHAALELHVFAPAWTLPILARMPSVQKTHFNPFAHGVLNLSARYKMGRTLAAEHFDQVIVLPNSLKSALIPFFASIPKRTGFLGEIRYGLLNDARTLDTEKLPHMIDRFNALAEEKATALLVGEGHFASTQPQLQPCADNLNAALNELGLNRNKPIISLCLGAEYGSAKRWPAVHFASLAAFCVDAGYQVWLFGSDKERDLGAAVKRHSTAAHLADIQDLCGSTNLAQAIDLLSISTGVVCNDSGLMHIAAALSVPVLALYGSSSPKFTPPLSPKAEVLSLNLACSPCFKRICPLQHLNCLNNLLPDNVWRTLQKVL